MDTTAQSAGLPLDLDNPAPLVPVRLCFTDHRRGRIGYTPFSEWSLRYRIRLGLIPTVKLGPRLECLTRKTILDLQRNGLPTAPPPRRPTPEK